MNSSQSDALVFFGATGDLAFKKIFPELQAMAAHGRLAEDFGIQGRGGLYEETGAIRDVIQNHRFQVLTNLAMEPAAGDDRESIRDAKVAVLKAIPTVAAQDLVRGQFIGYRDEPDVAADSKVETHAAMRLEIENVGTLRIH